MKDVNILVVGSINMDLVVKMKEIPKIGETIMGDEILEIPGGKGANQAVTMGKLGKKVSFLGKVGKDGFGQKLLDTMTESGVNTAYIEKEDIATGMAIINVDKVGNNNIVFIPGANFKVDKAYINRNISAFQEADIVVFQLEIPMETVKEGLKLSKSLGKTTILNPAPAEDLDHELIGYIDILIPNEHELERISKVKITGIDSMKKAGRLLLDKGIKEVIVTLGDKGVLYINEETEILYPAYKVKAIDTTGAGDSFIGGFTSFYLQANDIEKAIDMGQRTASLTVQKLGAQTSLPSLEEVLNYKLF